MYILRITRILFYLLPKSPDMYIDSSCITGILISPYNIQKILSAIDFILIHCKKLQKIKFLCCQINLFTCNKYTSAFTVHTKIAHLNALCLFFLLVVASRTAGNAVDVLDGGRYGVLVDPLDIAGMAQAILRQCDPATRILPGARVEEFDIRRTLDAYAALFGTIVGAVSPPQPTDRSASSRFRYR